MSTRWEEPSTEPPPKPRPEDDTSSVGGGVLIGFALQALLIVFLPAIVFVGVAQLVYIVPAYLIARGSGKFARAKGILIAASIVFLLNAACFAMLASMRG